MRKATPPIGVIAPIQRMPVRLNMYKLPEKTTMPNRNAQPAMGTRLSGQRAQAQATASSARAWYM